MINHKNISYLKNNFIKIKIKFIIQIIYIYIQKNYYFNYIKINLNNLIIIKKKIIIIFLIVLKH